MSLDFLESRMDFGETFSVGDVVYDDDSVGASVVAGCYCSEALLASCVSDLEFKSFALLLDCTDFEVDSDGGDVIFRERVVSESEKDTGLAHSRVSDEQYFKNATRIRLPI